MCHQYATPYSWFVADPNRSTDHGGPITAQECGHLCIVEWTRCRRFKARLRNPFLDPCAEEAAPEDLEVGYCPECELAMWVQKDREHRLREELMREMREREDEEEFIVEEGDADSAVGMADGAEVFEIYEDEGDADVDATMVESAIVEFTEGEADGIEGGAGIVETYMDADEVAVEEVFHDAEEMNEGSKEMGGGEEGRDSEEQLSPTLKGMRLDD